MAKAFKCDYCGDLFDGIPVGRSPVLDLRNGTKFVVMLDVIDKPQICQGCFVGIVESASILLEKGDIVWLVSQDTGASVDVIKTPAFERLQPRHPSEWGQA